ncbi:universal stress protein [Robiginitalea sp. SC105]|uniref:universal stress protein n=1 Tax=Robiginitalea sp. SC105 TaxID=2762332 RepID=UPI001639A286|nr:universal stress protein [Robiginitalea sp. SC105]MBC2838177.1 universal stress protein [Robiginitalea sp. SC105]
MALSGISYKTLLFGFAFSPNLEANLMEVTRLAGFLQARLILLHVGVPTAEKKKQLGALLEGIPKGPEAVQVAWREGEPVPVILEAAVAYGVDLLLLGARQHEHGYRFYMGSIARQLTRKIRCSVLLLIRPAIERVPCQHIVVNGLDDPDTPLAIATAFRMSQVLGAKQVTVVEEIRARDVAVEVVDDRTLKRATLMKERIKRRENSRVLEIVAQLPRELTRGITLKTQPIFGKRGYSIGHFAEVVRADLLVMNAPRRSQIWGRIFPQDIEYILSDLPTDLLIVRNP